jgi:hypothetical protein
MESMGRALTGVRRTWPLLLALATLRGQQYKADKAGSPPPEVASSITRALQQTGFQISAKGAAYCEIWFRTSLPSGVGSNEQNVTLAKIPQGALLGVVRFDGNGLDRRGQTIQAGVYTLRYGIMPANDSHQGAAPQRDFLLLTPAAEDRDVNATPSFDALVAMSRKASRTTHPAVLSFWKADADSPGFGQQGDGDWVLQSKVGDIPIAVIVVGTAGS